jgi:methylphosphotriester-DNA--protein-cysteine methyltransferase
MDENGNFYMSEVPGLLGGNSKGRIYGRLDCPAAKSAIDKGGYIEHRVFFKDEETAIKAGFRPCGRCIPGKYAEWKKKTNPAKE